MKYKILIVDDDFAIRTSLELLLSRAGYIVYLADLPAKALSILQSDAIDLVIMDMNYSRATTGGEGLALLAEIRRMYQRLPVILITAWGSIELAVQGMKLGASDFIAKPWDNDLLVRAVNTALLLSETPTRHDLSRETLDKLYDFRKITGKDPRLLNILETVGRVAKTDAPVLIEGESGTGKEQIAEAIHYNSLRAGKPFIKVNLGGIPGTLFESEMFGHVKGAFTGASQNRKGRFELADGGTIFLDEVGELSMSSQVKLLRVLQEGSFEVLGSSQTRRVDVRVVSATNRNLAEMVGEGEFREDLYYRLNLIRLQIPSLRERRSDIAHLLDSFFSEFRQKHNRPQATLSPEAKNWLCKHDFPGNVRELKNLLERLILVSSNNLIELSDFDLMNQDQRQAGKNELPPVGSMTLEQIEVSMIKKALKHYNHNITQAARSLGMSRAALYRRLEKYKITHEA
jgi:DNA-binding NtrC family response regulator